MSHTFHELYVHCVWATWDRLPLITPVVEPRLYGVIQKKCEASGCEALAVGGIADHIHVVVRFAPAMAIATLVGNLKGASSHLVNRELRPDPPFKWQSGYGVFTVDRRALPTVIRYVQRQKHHHTQQTLIDYLEQGWHRSRQNRMSAYICTPQAAPAAFAQGSPTVYGRAGRLVHTPGRAGGLRSPVARPFTVGQWVRSGTTYGRDGAA